MAASAGQVLKSTMEEFNRACNALSELAFQRDLHRKYDIHHQGYRLIRQQTNLPAQHVINAIAKVSAVYTRDSNKLIKFLTGPIDVPVIKAQGMEPAKDFSK